MRPAVRLAVLCLPLALVISGCGADVQPSPTPATTPTAATLEPTTRPSESPAALSPFEQQLPLTGSFVSQAVETEGTVRIERRDDGSVWILLEGLRTGSASDLRVHLKPDLLERDAQGSWTTPVGGIRYEIGTIDPTVPDHAIEVPGAHEMPEMLTVTLFEYVSPFPSFGSAALG